MIRLLMIMFVVAGCSELVASEWGPYRVITNTSVSTTMVPVVSWTPVTVNTVSYTVIPATMVYTYPPVQYVWPQYYLVTNVHGWYQPRCGFFSRPYFNYNY